MDKSYVIALVAAWMTEHPEHYCAWVRPFTQLRWSPTDHRLISTRVGGHWRRLAQWARVMPALNCTCKFEKLSKPTYLSTPTTVTKPRFTEEGDFIPRRYRVLTWA